MLHTRRALQNQRGAVLVLVGIAMVAICGIAGLAIDGAHGYVTRAELSRAVDAAALGGAGSIRLGQSFARERALSLAAANGVDPRSDPAETLSIEFGVNEAGENTVHVSATRVIPTWFMRVLGPEELLVVSEAEAATPPLDLVFVLDQSGSLSDNGAWDDLQTAAKDFVSRFDDDLDQLGLVSFQLRGTERVLIGAPFTNAIQASIDAMQSAGDTNTGEGLRLALRQLEAGPVREHSVKAVVLFTDGRPTAVRDEFEAADRILAVFTSPGVMRGYFDEPEELPTDQQATPDGCDRSRSCFGIPEPEAREAALQSGLARAAEIRQSGAFIFAIGLGDLGSAHPLEVPDHDYMRMIANEGGVAAPDEPQGSYYFAPSADELDEVFDAVAQDILVRLTQ